jgi:hypothetical protein
LEDQYSLELHDLPWHCRARHFIVLCFTSLDGHLLHQ